MAVQVWIGSLVVETQRREFLHETFQSVFLLVDYVQVVGQCCEQVLAPWHNHVPARNTRF